MQKLSCHTVRKQEDRKTSFSPGFRSWLVTMCLHDAAHGSARANDNAQRQKKQDPLDELYDYMDGEKKNASSFHKLWNITGIISPPRRPWHCCEGRRLRLRGLSKASLRSFLSKLCFVDQNKRIQDLFENSTVILLWFLFGFTVPHQNSEISWWQGRYIWWFNSCPGMDLSWFGAGQSTWKSVHE